MKITDFQRILGAEVVSNFGSMLSRLVLPWLAALTLAATPFEMGLLLVADVAAGAAGSLLLGAAVDRMGKRAVMVVADLARALLLGALAWLAVAGHMQFWMLIVAGAARGLLTVAFELARSAWVAQRVNAVELPARNAQLSAGGSLAETAAFALGGWLYQWLGVLIALLIDAGSYALSALCLRGVRETPPEPAAVQPRGRRSPRLLLAEVRDGIASVMATPGLRALAGIEILAALAMSLAGTSYMIFVSRDLGFSTGVLGMIFATGGVGALAGAALSSRLGRRFSGGGAIMLGLLLASLGAFCIPFAPGATIAGAVLLIAHQIIGDSGQTVYQVHDRTLRQTAVPAGMLARVDGGIRTLGQLAMLIGALGGGMLAAAWGARSTLAISAALFACAALLAYVLLVVRGSHVDAVA